MHAAWNAGSKTICVLACGNNSSGALGVDTPGAVHIPRPILSLPVAKVRWIACGHAHLAIVTTNHDLLTMGDNQVSELSVCDI
jgi:alpha-tubulin suppressor-like RCC1 family protein